MFALLLLTTITFLYAGYNLLIKLSGTHVPAATTTAILATISLQLAALVTSLLFLVHLISQGNHIFALPPRAYLWAVLAGLCIGAAEIGYFYLFGGIGIERPMPARVAIPTIVAGTVVLATLGSAILFGERLDGIQIMGSLLVVAGILVMFMRRGIPG